MGEVAFIEVGQSLELGRDHDGSGALRFFRQRPYGAEARPPLGGPGISRKQLRVRGRPGSLAVESVGRCPMLVGGEVTARALLLPGETLLLKGQLLLQCVARPRQMCAARDFPASLAGGFGEVDALGFVGESPSMWELRDQLAFAAKAGGHVLLTGESGTGKELAARGIHRLSSRSAGPFVGRNAATIPAGLADAELFGNVRNYPNPGTPERRGLIGESNGGTLFLDEIGELPTDLQSHLLRVLDGAGEYHRLGESAGRRADLRLVGATNRDPAELKHDLVPRLALRVELPPLAERREDIPLLVRYLLDRAVERARDAVARFRRDDGEFNLDPALVEALLCSPLPGNVRDVDAALWAAMSESRGGSLGVPRSLKRADPEPTPRFAPAESARRAPPTEAEVREVITKRNGNLVRAAADLGLSSRYRLYRLLKELGISLDAVRSR